MAKIVGLPKLSPTMDEGVLVRWVKKEGEAVQVDDLLAEVETDKATMEFRSFDAGTLLKILVPEGQSLAPDTPVAIIGKAGEDVSALLAGKTAKAAAATPTAVPTAVPTAKLEAPAAGVASAEAAAPAAAAGRTLASPLVRRLAREHDIALADVPGSGPGGRVVKRDLDSALAGASPANAPATAAAVAKGTGPAAPAHLAAPHIEKLTPMRRTIARRLSESKREVPHFYLTIDVDAEPIGKLRAQINQDFAKQGAKVSVNDLIIKAVAAALRRVPQVNASFMGDSIHLHQRVDISVAVSIPDGLVTPVVRDADRKGVLEISTEVRELATKARERKLKPEEMQDGTFSVSNLGMFGIEEFSAVINPPEGAILAVGTIRHEPVLRDGQVVAGQRMRLTLSCDHRVIDGAVGAQWLATLKQLLEAPVQMIL